MQNAVDAVANLELIFEGLDMHIRRPAFESADQHLIDQPDDRHFRGHVAQMGDIFIFRRYRRTLGELFGGPIGSVTAAVQRFDAGGDLFFLGEHRL